MVHGAEKAMLLMLALSSCCAASGLAGVPPSFDCAMRKAAYAFGQKLIPRLGVFEPLHTALNLNSADCHEPLREPSFAYGTAERTTPETTLIPAEAIYAAPGGHADADADGSVDRPFASIQAAADAAAARTINTVVLRAGTYYLTRPIELTARHSGLRFVAHPKDPTRPVVSGGQPLKLSWKPYNVSSKPPPPGGLWKHQGGMNAAYGAVDDNQTFSLYGIVANALQCQNACQSASGHRCQVWTWCDSQQGSFANQCWFRLDGQWAPRTQDGHVSGYNATLIEPPPNVWVADVGDQVDEIPGLQIDGVRATRARFPNLRWGIEASPGYGGMVDGNAANWTPPDFARYGKVRFHTDANASHTRPNGGWFEHYMIGVGGLCSVYEPPVSYWCSEHPSGGGAFAFRTPSGVTPHVGALPHAPYRDPSEALFFVWRPARWANWMFEVGAYDRATNNFTFGKGGNQGARGENSGGDWFVENVFEELDAPGEFFFDRHARKLYLFHNGTGAPHADAVVVAPQLRTLLNISGTQWEPVRNVSQEGIAFRATRYTYMDPHGVPSAGDWALDRVGAVFLQGTESVVMRNCTFERLDGNGVMVSGYNRNTTIVGSDFAYLGGNAIAAWGYTNETDTDPGRPGVLLANAPAAGVDGTDGEHPRYTSVLGCTAREVGLYEKQSSFFVQAKTAQSTILGNVFFNGPRAGINANDGFGGGDEIAHNLVFSTCRESGDHGPFNSWDRQPFLTTVRNGTPSMRMAWRQIHHNFFIDNYSPQENVDNDDGSAFFHTYSNFLVYGNNGMKNDFGGHDNHHYGNVYAYAGAALWICPQLPGHEDYFYKNRVVLTGERLGGFACDGDAKTVLHDNEYYTPSGNVIECKMDLHAWQAKGNDPGSTVATLPSDETIIGWAKEILAF